MKKFKVFLFSLFVCIFCTHGVFADCDAGWGLENGECVKCPAGWYSPGGTSECKKCGGGRYSSSAGSVGCTKCSPGTYAPAPGADSVNTSCQPCPNGQYQNAEGQSSCKECNSAHNLMAPYISPDKTECKECPAGNCCYNYGAYICKKGTYSSGGVGCQAAFTELVQVCPAQRSEGGSGGDENSGGSVGGDEHCIIIPTEVPIAGVRKGVCTVCSGGKTTAGQGAISGSECNIQSASEFKRVINGDSESFSWPIDGSVSEQSITSSNVIFGNSD